MLSNFLLYVLPGFLAGVFVTMMALAYSTRHEMLILLHLLEHKESYGLDLIKAGCGKRGTIYVRLHRMEERGLLVSHEEATSDVLAMRGGRPRRIYTITDAGRAALMVERARWFSNPKDTGK